MTAAGSGNGAADLSGEAIVRGGLRLLPPLRLLDSLAGAALGALFGVVLVWAGGAVAIQVSDEPELRREVRQSEVLRRLNAIASPKDVLNLDSLERARKPLDGSS